MLNGEKQVRIYSLFGNQALIMENKDKKLPCPYGTTGRICEQSLPKEKFLISATKHKEIKITVYIANKDNNNMLINFFSVISKAILRLIGVPVVIENMTVSVFVKMAKQPMQRPKLHFLYSV